MSKQLKTKIVDRWREQNLLTEKTNRHNNVLRFDQMAEEAIKVVNTDLSSRKVDLDWRYILALVVGTMILIGAVFTYFVLTDSM